MDLFWLLKKKKAKDFFELGKREQSLFGKGEK